MNEEEKDQYIKNLYDQRQKIIDKMDVRKKKREDLAKRGSLASKRRMRALAGMVEAQDTDKILHH